MEAFERYAFSQEPALWIALANAVLLVIVNFGIPISGDQKVAIDTLLGALLALTAGFATRSQVTPTASIPLPIVAQIEAAKGP